MKPGPKPRPAEIADLIGNPGHRPIARLPDDATASTASRLEPPAWLAAPAPAHSKRRSKRAAAAAATDPLVVWQQVTAAAATLPFIRATDQNALARYCVHLARWMDLNRAVVARGAVYTTRSNHGELDRVRPEQTLMLKIETVLLALEDRLGLSPAARQSLLIRLADLPRDQIATQPSAPGTASPDDVDTDPATDPHRLPMMDLPASPVGIAVLASRNRHN